MGRSSFIRAFYFTGEQEQICPGAGERGLLFSKQDRKPVLFIYSFQSVLFESKE